MKKKDPLNMPIVEKKPQLPKPQTSLVPPEIEKALKQVRMVKDAWQKQFGNDNDG